jgi:histidinol-phosphate aminotransferase
MSAALDFVRPMVREMPAYEPVPSLERTMDELGLQADELIKLDANENPYGPLPEVRTALGKLPTAHIYPDPECRRLRSRLAQYHGVDEKNIVVGAGLDEVIDLIMRVCIDPGDGLLNCPPTFGMYAFGGALYRARLVTVPRRADFSLDLDSICKAAAEEKPKLMILANPNNPDGSLTSMEVLRQLAELPLLLVLDEAYVQFCDQESSLMDEVEKRDNLVVLRTFSKWAGLAGLRIGYGVFPPEIAAALMKVKQPYNVSAAAELAAVVTMDNIAKTEPVIASLREQRDYLYNELLKIDWLTPYPTQTNFVLCRVRGSDAYEAAQALRKQGIMVRAYKEESLQDALRISVGTAVQITKLVAVLKEMR